MYKNVLIIADIEGSSACCSYEGSRFLTGEWAAACIGMSLDVAAAVAGCFEAGAETVMVKDFHRTGYNVLPELVDPRARIVHGYIQGPVPGLGDPGQAEAVLYVGLHAPSGTDGFLAHTMTSRIARLEVNGRLMSEVELFSASLAPWGIRPVFFSGCPTACALAEIAVPGLMTYPIDKSKGLGGLDATAWREGLKRTAGLALSNTSARPFLPEGPFRAVVTMRDGEIAARKIEKRWKFERRGASLLFEAEDMHELYMKLIRLAYLTPLTDRFTPAALGAFNLWGRLGLAWVRRKSNSRPKPPSM